MTARPPAKPAKPADREAEGGANRTNGEQRHRYRQTDPPPPQISNRAVGIRPDNISKQAGGNRPRREIRRDPKLLRDDRECRADIDNIEESKEITGANTQSNA